ncbi:ABC transporter substrate-binding protein [Vibrio sp. HN007]|uniref:ABC transporter substrate-binding protein n=1 Tax=Vibrio iocasae TaxID=3098914 RepID=UPI0035D505A5
MKKTRFIKLWLFALWGVTLVSYAKQDLKVSLLSFNGAQRAAYHNLFEQFSTQNPDINLIVQNYEAEKYKSEINQWLESESHSDVMYWFSGERLRAFVKKGLVSNLDNEWLAYQWDTQFTQGARSSVTYNNNKYGLPVHYYPWAIYYKKSLFEKLNISPPTDWPSFIAASEKLKENGIAPIVIGSKNYWTLAAWFDYLNLRINGLEFHERLVTGDVSYKSQRIAKVFEYWKSLIDRGYFLDGHQGLTWREALPFLYRNKGGMMLMGNFWTSQIPESLYDDVEMIRFPVIDTSVQVYEEAPTNVWIVPQNANNKADGVKLLQFMAQSRVQQELNSAIGMIAPNPNQQQVDDHFIKQSYKILANASGVSQFYDRDNPQPIASEGIKQFARFVADPSSLPLVLEELEKLREQSF